MSWKKSDAKKLLEGVYSDQYSGQELPRHLFQFTSKEIIEGFESGWKKKILSEPNIVSADMELAQAFQKNLFYFSANKTATQVSELNKLLFDKKGHRRPINKFVEDALQLDKKFNADFLETEYNTTLRLAQSGREWLQIQETKDSFPLLEFVSVNDANTRHSHQERDGVIQPVDSDWWLVNMPPLDYNCRCTTKQHAAASVTPLESRDIPEPSKTIQKQCRCQSSGLGQRGSSIRSRADQRTEELNSVAGVRSSQNASSCYGCQIQERRSQGSSISRSKGA